MVIFKIGDIEVQSEWNDSETARRILEALPIDSSGNYESFRQACTAQ